MMINYFLAINKWKVEVFKLDDSKPNYQKKLDKLQEKYKDIRQILVDEETKQILKKHRKITKDDVKYLLKKIVKTLAANDNFENVQHLFLANYKRDRKMNPIFVILMRSTSIYEILKMLDFPRKQIILEILGSQKSNKAKYEDIKKIDKISYIEEQMTKKIQTIVTMWVSMLIVVAGVVWWLKFKLAPKIAEFLSNIQQSLWLQWWVHSEPLISVVANNFFIVWIVFLGIVGFVLLLKILYKKYFFIILYKLPLISSLLRIENNISLLMLYTFYKTNPHKFVDSLKKQFWEFVDEKRFNWENYNSIPDIVDKLHLYFQKNLGIEIYDLDIKSDLERYWQISNADELVSEDIERYFDDLLELTAKIMKMMTNIIIMLVWLVVGIVFVSLILTLREVPDQIEKMKQASWI